MKPSLIAVALLCTILLGGNHYESGATSSAPSTSAPTHCDAKKKNNPQLVKVPSLKNSWQIQRDCRFPVADHVSFVIDVFYKKWKKEFGDENKKVLKTLNNLMIEWGEKPKPIVGGAFDVNGKPIEGTARGLTLLPTYIWVWENQYERIAATALVHELVHAALWSSSGIHGDPDHEGPEFKGWTPRHTEFIREINILLAGLDI